MRSNAATSSSSRSRPMNDVVCCGRLFGVASSVRSAGKSGAKLRMHYLEDALGIGEIAQAHGPQVTQRHCVRQALADERCHGL